MGGPGKRCNNGNEDSIYQRKKATKKMAGNSEQTRFILTIPLLFYRCFFFFPGTRVQHQLLKQEKIFPGKV